MEASPQEQTRKLVREESIIYDDLLDYDSVDVLEEQVNDIVSISRLSDTAADKFTFTIFLFNVMLTGFLVGYMPQYFYYWHSVKCVCLLFARWYMYKPKGWHYFLLDFCYFTNFLILVYFWLPWKPNVLFPIIFVFSNGPLLWAIATWRNSLVPHSVDKMTSVFIHASPAFVTWAVRWHSSEEKSFLLCQEPSAPGSNGCDHVGWIELLAWPMFAYGIWLALYILIVLIWRRKRIAERNYETTVLYMTQRAKKQSIYNILGEKYNKPVFLLWQTVYTVISIGSAYVSYHSKEYGMIMIAVMLLVSCYNGSTFYIDVMAHKYYQDKQRK